MGYTDTSPKSHKYAFEGLLVIDIIGRRRVGEHLTTLLISCGATVVHRRGGPP